MKTEATVLVCCTSRHGNMPTMTVLIRMYTTATAPMDSTMERGIVRAGSTISSPILQTWL